MAANNENSSLIAAESGFKEKNVWTSAEKRIWVVTLFLGTTILFTSRLALPVCAFAMSKEFGWNKEHLGTVMGCFFWGYAMTQIAGGYVADRVGGDRVLSAGALVWGLITFATPHVAYLTKNQTITLLLLGFFRVLLGLSQGVHFPSMTSLLSNNVRESNRAFSMSVVSSGSNFGSLLCGGIGSLILEHHGWQDVFHFIGLLALLWSVLTWHFSNVQRRGASLCNTELKKSIPMKSVPWRSILTKVPFWSAICNHFFHTCSYFILVMWLPTYFHEKFPMAKGWVFNVVPWTASIPASFFGGWLSEKLIRSGRSVTYTRKFIEAIAMIGGGLFSMILPFCNNYRLALVVCAIAVSCQTFHNSSVLVNPQDIAPTYAGSVFGIMNMGGAVLGFVGVYFVGYILNVSGSWTIVFTSIFVCNITGLAAFLLGGTGKQII